MKQNNDIQKINGELAAGILSNIDHGIMATNMSGEIIYYNTIAEKILEYEKGDILGKNFDEVFQLYHAETKERLASPIAYVLHHHLPTGLEADSVLWMKNNSLKYISAACSPIYDTNGIMMGAVAALRDITRLRTSELSHISEEQNLMRIFNNIPTATIILDDHGKALRANEIFLDFMGKMPEDIIGMSFGKCINCMVEKESEFGCGTGQRCPECEINRAVTDAINCNRLTYNIESKLSANIDNQIEYWVRASVTPIFTGVKKTIAVTLVDITAAKRQEMDAKKARDHCTNILNQLPFTVWMSDSCLNWSYSNRIMDEITGVPIMDTPMKEWYRFIHPDDARNYNEEVQETLTKQIPFMKEVRFRSKDGSYRWVLLNAAPYYEADGTFAGIVGSSLDVSERKEQEEDIRRYQELLLASKEAAETANKAKSEFLANISHEIRTPINGIVGMVDLTLLTELTEDQRDNLITAKACANSLITIVNDVLDFSKMEAGKMTLENITFDMKELIEEIIKAHSPKATDKGLELNYTFSSRVPQYIVGDPNRLRQVLNNLISNAIKFTMRGEVTLVVKSTKVTKEEAELVFSVTDSGIGITKEDIGRLFHSFTQIENSYTRQFGGTGLGLVISKQLIEMMGGGIEVESEYGVGSTFRFFVKFPIGNAIVTNKKILPSITRAEKQLYLLLVEDDKINQKVIQKMLVERGYSVETAGDGMEALEKYARNSYDAILMDIQMPKMNGIETAAKIRSLEPEGRHIPIIALTAYSLPGDREKFIKLGMDEYVSKPIQIDTLFHVLEQVTSKQNYGTPENIVLTEDGELIFTFDKPDHESKINEEVLEELTKKIDLLRIEAECDNITRMETIAKEIKRIAGSIDATDIKDTAFKIELAARRGNLTDLKNYTEQISYEFKLYQRHK